MPIRFGVDFSQRGDCGCCGKEDVWLDSYNCCQNCYDVNQPLVSEIKKEFDRTERKKLD